MVGTDIPTYTNIVARLLVEIDALLHSFVYDGYRAISGYMTVPLGLVATLYIVILGYAISIGSVRLHISTFVKTVLKIAFIYMAVTQWGWISENFVGFINSAIGGVGDALVSATPIHIPGVGGIDGAMQLVLIQFTKIGAVLFNTGGFTNMGGWLCGLIVWAFGYVMISMALCEIILSKIMLAILFIFTPLIVVFCFFKPLQGMFDRWLGMIVGFALMQLFVTAALVLALSLAYWWTGAHIAESALQIGYYGTLPIIIIGCLCIFVIWEAGKLGIGIGGAVITSSGSAMMAGLVGGVVGGAIGSLNFFRSDGKDKDGDKDGGQNSGGRGTSSSMQGGLSNQSEAQSVMRDTSTSLQTGE